MTDTNAAQKPSDRSSLETVPVLVIGATLAGLGLAYAGKERTLVVERTSGPGQESIACFNPGERLEEEVSSEAAVALREELKRRNLLSAENRLHLGGLAPVLFNRIRSDGLRVLFLTEVVSVEREREDEFAVTLFHASGLTRIRTRYIVDTTSRCLSAPDYRPEIRYKTLNAMLHCANPQESLPLVNDENAELVQGRFPGELILKLRLDPADDWPTARDKLHRYWANRRAAFGPWTMAVVADAFEIGAPKGPHTHNVGGDRRVWLPSCAYANALQAFDAGYGYGKEGIPHEAVATNR